MSAPIDDSRLSHLRQLARRFQIRQLGCRACGINPHRCSSNKILCRHSYACLRLQPKAGHLTIDGGFFELEIAEKTKARLPLCSRRPTSNHCQILSYPSADSPVERRCLNWATAFSMRPKTCC